MRYDFSGWATRNDLKCSDGRTIRKDAFKSNDGQTVPLVWNHQHNDAMNVLGHALLENREDGVYAYCTFNETESGRNAKLLVEHGDVSALSIYANQLKQQGADVLHGAIREVSLVLAGANPGAYIDSVMCHGRENEEEAIIYTGEEISLYHADDGKKKAEDEKKDDTSADGEKKEDQKAEDNKTLADVFETFTEEQKTVVYALMGQALEDAAKTNEDDKSAKHSDLEGGDNSMKKNIFDQTGDNQSFELSHSDQASIIGLAKNKSVGTLQNAISMYAENNKELAHGIDDIDTLFPDYKDVYPGAPEVLLRDQGWVDVVMSKAHKSPISRIRTRQTDARDVTVRGSGYQKTKKKAVAPNVKLLKRTTDPQTVYRKDALNRDDIVDITDFDVVEYQYGIMRSNLNEEIATAIMIGDGREDGDEAKISEEHIRSIWHDDELYTIHTDVDFAAAKAELQGSNTGASFGTNYIYAEAIITAALYSREQYKGHGTPDFYCTPHLLNIMLLARDMTGRRIYDSKSDLAAALNVGNIYTAEQFEGRTRTTKDVSPKTKKLLGIFVNMDDYQIGATKGGEITRFNQFDIDFNQEKYLIETRISGALTRVYSAIALEEDVTKTPSGGDSSSQTDSNV